MGGCSVEARVGVVRVGKAATSSSLDLSLAPPEESCTQDLLEILDLASGPSQETEERIWAFSLQRKAGWAPRRRWGTGERQDISDSDTVWSYEDNTDSDTIWSYEDDTDFDTIWSYEDVVGRSYDFMMRMKYADIIWLYDDIICEVEGSVIDMMAQR